MLGPLLRPRRPTPICQPRWKIRKKAARMANIMGNSWSPSVLSLFWPFFPCDWSIKWCVKTESGICVLYSQWWGLVLVKYFVKSISRDFPTKKKRFPWNSKLNWFLKKDNFMMQVHKISTSFGIFPNQTYIHKRIFSGYSTYSSYFLILHPLKKYILHCEILNHQNFKISV